MDKLRLLNNLKEYVIKTGTIRENYVRVHDGGSCSYCAVGYLLRETDFPVDELAEDSERNEQTAVQSHDILEHLVKFGFTPYELDCLQEENDNPFVKGKDRVESIIKEIDLIAEGGRAL